MINPISSTLATVIFLIGLVYAVLTRDYVPFIGCAFIAVIVLYAIRIASEWDRVVILRLGRYNRTVGPGIFLMIPLVDVVASWIDTRTRAIMFSAEATPTSDTVPVDVDGVMFTTVTDPTRAAIQVQDYMKAMSLAAQTALRNSIGSTDLQHLLTNRTDVDKVLQDDIAQKTADWGISVSSVELRDVRMPQGLQDAMSREAQAEREKRARVKLAEAEPAIAEQFVQAATTYGQNTTAFALRGMNMTYEMANKSTMVVIPNSMVETMDAGRVVALASGIQNSRDRQA
jgi:regulator of protease activity HflC (stomatin/prohibitin superfamily)